MQQDIYFDDMNITHGKSKIIQADDYYPFGLTFNSYQRENSVINFFLYSGKEQQDELGLNWSDFGARMYMADIGRWGAVDPMSEKARRWTPYRYAFNNPLRFIDPDGMFEYSNGYTTQESRNETGSVEHYGAFDNSKEANKINSVIDRAAASAELRQNAVATMDAALGRRTDGSQAEQVQQDDLTRLKKFVAMNFKQYNYIKNISWDVADDIIVRGKIYKNAEAHFEADYRNYKQGDRMTITIKRSVLADPKLLKITIGHELQHALHTWTGLMSTWQDKYGYWTGQQISEYQAYLWEIEYYPESDESWRRLYAKERLLPDDYRKGQMIERLLEK